MTKIFAPVISGPDTSPTTGASPNALAGRLRVGETQNYIVLDPTPPLRMSMYDSGVEKLRVGNLSGFLGYSAAVYGIAIGDPGNYLKYDAANGLRISGSVNATSGAFRNVTLGETGVASGTLTLQIAGGAGDTYIAAGKTDFVNSGAAGFILGIDDSDADTPKFYIGSATNYLNWDGVNLSISGAALSGLTGYVADSAFNDHSARHENAGADQINVAGLLGELADPQPPKSHGNTAHSTPFQPTSEKNAANGYAGINSSSRATVGIDASDDLIVDIASKGLVMKDTQATPHYWRLGVTTMGLLTTTDLGTVKP